MEHAEFRCKWIAKRDIRLIADQTREEFWPQGSLPVDVETIIAFKLRLEIDPVHFLSAETDMEAYLKGDLSGIVVDHDRYMLDKFRNRMRFSFAHELGHFFLHREIYERFKFSTAEEWKEFVINIPEREYSNFESQANEFAGRFLVPHNRLVTEIERVCDTIKEKKLVDYLKVYPEAVLSRVSPSLCKPFGVSTEVIMLRVYLEELWPPDL
jgi:hypothetical protein